MKKVFVVGSGISGLSSALTLIREGYKVKILAKSFPPETTSNKAAAFWSPYYANGDRVARWSQESYFEYEKLAGDPATGISMTKLHRFRKKDFEEAESWEEAIPEGRLRIMSREELPRGYEEGFEVEVPLIETHIFLPWLMDEFKRAGGTSEKQELKSLYEIQSEDSVIVNCCGLGAIDLCQDGQLVAVKGQVVMVDTHLDIPIILDESSPTYIVQRKDGCILGGTREENVFTETTDEETLSSIISRTAEFYPQLKSARRLTHWAGLRPYRSEVRLEREGNIIHNYGHGGSGFTLAWGCAREVLYLLR